MTKNKFDKHTDKMLSGLLSIKEELLIKEESKNWPQITVPYTLSDGLANYPKYKLDNIRRRLNIANASHLKKAELVALLASKLRENLADYSQLWDGNIFQILSKLAAKNCTMKADKLSNRKIGFLRDNGLIFTGVMNNQKIISLPSDMVAPIQSLKENQKIQQIIRRNTEWWKLSYGLLYYYGSLRPNQLIKLVETYTKETIDSKDFIAMMHEVNLYHDGIIIDEYGYSDMLVIEPEWVQKEHQKRKDVPFYPFSKQQLFHTNETDFVRNKSHWQFVRYLTDNFNIEKEIADEIVVDCVIDTKSGNSPNEVMAFLSEIFEFENLDAVQECMSYLVDLMNNTKEWALKGHTSIELRPTEITNLQPTSKLQQKQNQTITVTKVGRNEPCPCGSGKKYKKCCGAS